MNKERVCAIVLDYFGAEKTERCLLSLGNQGVETVYIVDNSGSETATAKLRDVIHRLQSAGMDYKIEVISAAKNLGFARGVNFALSYDRRSESPHDYYLLLNNDAVAGPGLVSGLLATLNENSRAVLAAPRIKTARETITGTEIRVMRSYHSWLACCVYLGSTR